MAMKDISILKVIAAVTALFLFISWGISLDR